MTQAARILAQAEARLDLGQRFRIARGRAQRALARLKFDPSEPRDETGKWTDGGGDSADDKLGPGYSEHAKLINGVIHTSNVYDAVLALSQDRKVELKQPKQVSTLIKKLGEITKEMVAKGEKAPNFDLCKVTVTGTNLFCADTKNIPRVKMPQMDEAQTKAFLKHLEGKGYKVEKDDEKSVHLRATQNQLNGAKVAKLAARIESGDGKENERRIVVSRDDYILDGHHHWAAQIALDARNNKLGGHNTKISRVDIDIITLLNEANKFTGGAGAQGFEDEKRARWRRMRAEAEAWLAKWDESQHPRVPGGPEGGQFTSGGEGSSADDAKLDPKVIAVGGDAWNKATARRLEREYQEAKPALETLTAKYAGLDAPPDVAAPPEPDEDEEPPYMPQSWGEMSSDDQDKAFEEYKSAKLSGYLESETTNWYDSGQALDDAKTILAENPEEDDWLQDAIQEHLDESDTRYPLTAEQLADGVTLDYQNGYDGGGKFTVEYLDKAIGGMIAENLGHQGQQTLPGIAPEDFENRLTDKMRDDLNTAIEKAFDKKAESKASDLQPPDYLQDSAEEFLDEDWNHNMSDEDKFEFVKNDTSIIESPDAPPPVEVTGLPNKFDPLNKTIGADYKRTQQLARALSVQRSEQVLEQRKLPNPGPATIRLIDTKLWQSWKASSTSPHGQLLQLATAEELGGRLNPKTGREGKIEINRDVLVKDADDEFKDIGGYAGVKAYVRAKWETTQYLLDKAGIPELKLYRGIALDKDKLEQARREKAFKQMVGDHAKVPNLTVVRNGAASTTTDPGVANGWSQSESRLVLRALVPRTAAVSIPAYGVNVQSEHEVVVAGTAWKSWDGWLGKAPEFERVAMAA